MRNESDLARGQSGETMVHHIEMQALQIRHVAGNMDRMDLPSAIWQLLIAAQKFFEHDAGLRRPIAIMDNILMLWNRPNAQRQRVDRFLFARRESTNAFELLNQDI